MDKQTSHVVSERRIFCTAGTRDVKLLTESTTNLGFVYRVDLRLRPGGESAPIVHSRDATLQYYDVWVALGNGSFCQGSSRRW